MNRHIDGLTEAVQAMEKYAARNRKNGTGEPSLIDYAIVAIAAYEEHMRPEVVDETAAESLPGRSVIVTEQGGVWEKSADAAGVVFWYEPGSDSPARTIDLTFPARVIHWGDSDA